MTKIKKLRRPSALRRDIKNLFPIFTTNDAEVQGNNNAFNTFN